MNRIGKCPVCSGTTRKPATDSDKRWNTGGYDKETHTVRCNNCGPKGMFSSGPDGLVELRKDNGQPCIHEYVEKKIGRCYHSYSCKHCSSAYSIDSGD